MKKREQGDSDSILKSIGATKLGVSTIGILGGIISMEHGIFEILHGNVPTPGIIIDAIGPEQRFWEEGGEMALTIIPNFLITGICAVIIGLITILWIIRYLDKKYGSSGLILLTVLTLLVGGGIAFFIFGIINGIVSMKINKPLTMQRLLSTKSLPILSKLWVFCLPTAVICSSIAILIAIFGIPFLTPDTTTDTAYVFGFMMIGFSILTYITGFAREILNTQKQNP